MKCPIYKLFNLWTVQFMNCSIYVLFNLWTVQFMNCSIFKLFNLWTVCSLKGLIYMILLSIQSFSMKYPNTKNYINFLKEKNLQYHVPCSLTKKYRIYKMAIYKIPNFWTVQFMKCPIYELSDLWTVQFITVQFINCSIYGLSNLWTVQFMNCLIYVLSNLWTVCSLKGPLWFIIFKNIPTPRILLLFWTKLAISYSIFLNNENEKYLTLYSEIWWFTLNCWSFIVPSFIYFLASILFT